MSTGSLKFIFHLFISSAASELQCFLGKLSQDTASCSVWTGNLLHFIHHSSASRFQSFLVKKMSCSYDNIWTLEREEGGRGCCLSGGICCPQVLHDVGAFEHLHPGVRILDVRRLEKSVFLEEILSLRAATRTAV